MSVYLYGYARVCRGVSVRVRQSVSVSTSGREGVCLCEAFSVCECVSRFV